MIALLIWFWFWVGFATLDDEERNLSSSDNVWLVPTGKCKKLWRKDRLVGRCFGLTLHSQFPELISVKTVNSPVECRTLCCNLGEKCVTWQYAIKAKECKLGPPVRLGLESAPTGDWCEPLPPGKWNGQRLLERASINKCEWGDRLPTQCFGLGPEQLNTTNGRLNTEACQQACCASRGCKMWQELPSRGCYFGSGDGVWCEKADASQEEYVGTRKCIPKFCGGLESEHLSDV
jgi:hypothetical protein